MHDFEKLGAFYLGKRYDMEAEKQTDELVLYDSKDLTTHAVIIGMTGSGKTGLGVGILEEAALDHIQLVMLVNDVSLRNLIPGELAKGFGFFQSKPSSAFSPVAVTPRTVPSRRSSPRSSAQGSP